MDKRTLIHRIGNNKSNTREIRNEIRERDVDLRSKANTGRVVKRNGSDSDAAVDVMVKLRKIPGVEKTVDKAIRLAPSVV